MVRSFATISLAACAVACMLVASPARAEDAKPGEARVVQRQGPMIEVERQQRPVAAVVFPSQNDSGLEVSILESDPKNPAADREAIFASKDAQQKGVITSDFGSNGNARRLTITARRQGAPAQVQELTSNGMARIFAVRHEQPKQQQPQDVAQNQQKQQNQQQANAQQPAGGQQDKAQQDKAQQASAQQPAQPQQPQEKPTTAEQNDAVIFLYLSGQHQ